MSCSRRTTSMGRRGSSATRSSSASESILAITIRWSARGIAELIGENDPRDPARKPWFADHGSAGCSRHLRYRAPARGLSRCSTIPGRRLCSSRRSRRAVDITILAATKYVGGHADVMLGCATATAAIFSRLQIAAWDLGHAVSADDAWLGSRGLRTMARAAEAARGERAEDRGVAERTAGGGPRAPPRPCRLSGSRIWKRDFKGSSGLFAFELKGAGNQRERLHRQPRTLRHRLQLGRIREPCFSRGPLPHCIRSARRESDPASYRS